MISGRLGQKRTGANTMAAFTPNRDKYYSPLFEDFLSSGLAGRCLTAGICKVEVFERHGQGPVTEVLSNK